MFSVLDKVVLEGLSLFKMDKKEKATNFTNLEKESLLKIITEKYFNNFNIPFK